MYCAADVSHVGSSAQRCSSVLRVLLGSLSCLAVTLSIIWALLSRHYYWRLCTTCLHEDSIHHCGLQCALCCQRRLCLVHTLVLVCFFQMMLCLSAGGCAASPDVSGLEVLQSTQQAQSCCTGVYSHVDANQLLLKAALVVCCCNKSPLCITGCNPGAVTKH